MVSALYLMVWASNFISQTVPDRLMLLQRSPLAGLARSLQESPHILAPFMAGLPKASKPTTLRAARALLALDVLR
jgi:hypothetical protein